LAETRRLPLRLQASPLGLFAGYLLLFVATRTWGPTSVAMEVLLFAFPIAAILVAWSVLQSRPLRQWDQAWADTGMVRATSLGLSGSVPTPIGGRRSAASQMASTIGVLCLLGGVVLIPRDAAVPGALAVAFSAWSMLAAAFIAFGLPRITPQG